MPEGQAHLAPFQVFLSASAALQERGAAVPFQVLYRGFVQSAFAIRFDGLAYAYLNRCAHMPMEMDFQPNQFFDSTAAWLICATHGALYAPQTGRCQSGPCRSGLVKIELSEADGALYWHTSALVQPAPL
jgi:nitrite reductase/ring-hydroxylating ferredoxin subunit